MQRMGRGTDMSRSREELLEAFRRKGGGWERTEAESLLRAYGFVVRNTGQGHVLWRNGRETLTLTQERFLKRPYVRLIIRTIDKIRESDPED
jgi:hypothetical protein